MTGSMRAACDASKKHGRFSLARRTSRALNFGLRVCGATTNRGSRIKGLRLLVAVAVVALGMLALSVAVDGCRGATSLDDRGQRRLRLRSQLQVSAAWITV
eukprot:5477850-Pleurochrysis_carterae.AAC.2